MQMVCKYSRKYPKVKYTLVMKFRRIKTNSLILDSFLLLACIYIYKKYKIPYQRYSNGHKLYIPLDNKYSYRSKFSTISISNNLRNIILFTSVTS